VCRQWHRASAWNRPVADFGLIGTSFATARTEQGDCSPSGGQRASISRCVRAKNRRAIYKYECWRRRGQASESAAEIVRVADLARRSGNPVNSRDVHQRAASNPMMSPETLAELVDRHGPGLTLYARQWCATAEDVVQDAFVKLAGEKPVPQRVVPWLYRVVRNRAIDAGRAERRRRHYETRAAGRSPSWFTPGADSAIDGQVATAALLALPPEQREIITLHLWSDLTFEEIAAVARCSTSTAHRWYAAGLAALRERLNVHAASR